MVFSPHMAEVSLVPMVICSHLSPQNGGWSPPGDKGYQPNRWPLPVWLQHGRVWAHPPAGWVTALPWDPGLGLHLHIHLDLPGIALVLGVCCGSPGVQLPSLCAVCRLPRHPQAPLPCFFPMTWVPPWLVKPLCHPGQGDPCPALNCPFLLPEDDYVYYLSPQFP